MGGQVNKEQLAAPLQSDQQEERLDQQPYT